MLSKTLLIIAATAALGAAQVPQRPQVPPRDAGRPGAAQPLPTGTASITGVVLMASGQPARKVRVNLSGTAVAGGGRGMAGRSTTTDDQGRFSFTALAAGRYSLSASKPGYLAVTYGQRRPGTPGTQIQLADGQKFEAQLQMPKGGVLTGVLLDEHGEPTPGTSVRAMRFRMTNGRRTLQMASSGSTDDRGMYRLYNLEPGDYVVCASPRNTAMGDYERLVAETDGLRRALESMAASRVAPEQMQAIQDRLSTLTATMPDQPDEAPSGYAPVCYPGTTAVGSASPIQLNLGEERPGIDFQLQLVPMARVEGMVMNSTGQPIQNMQVTLQDLTTVGSPLGNMSSARADAEGRFRFQSVAPGQYRITARATVGEGGRGRGRGGNVMELLQGRGGRGAQPDRPQPVVVWATADIVVDGRHLSNVMLALQPGIAVTGDLQFEGTAPQPTDLTRLRVTLSSADPGMAGPPGQGRVDANGRFTVPSVAPGRYRVAASGAPGWFVESATIGGQDALDVPFEVKPGQNPGTLTITFTDRQTQLTGTVVDDKNQPALDYTLVIFPSDQRYWTSPSRRIRTTRPATDGRYTFVNLPPGDYKLATVIDLDPNAIGDPAYLQSIESATMRITLQPGEKKQQDIRLR